MEKQLEEQLRKLGDILGEFSREIKKENPNFKLVETLSKDIMRKIFHAGLV